MFLVGKICAVIYVATVCSGCGGGSRGRGQAHDDDDYTSEQRHDLLYGPPATKNRYNPVSEEPKEEGRRPSSGLLKRARSISYGNGGNQHTHSANVRIDGGSSSEEDASVRG
jgi:hypothetical protein